MFMRVLFFIVFILLGKMVTSCVAFGCTNRMKKGSGISFHCFPHINPDLLNKWVCTVRRQKWLSNQNSFICSEHFIESDIPCWLGWNLWKHVHIKKRHCGKKEWHWSGQKNIHGIRISSKVTDNGWKKGQWNKYWWTAKKTFGKPYNSLHVLPYNFSFQSSSVYRKKCIQFVYSCCFSCV